MQSMTGETESLHWWILKILVNDDETTSPLSPVSPVWLSSSHCMLELNQSAKKQA